MKLLTTLAACAALSPILGHAYDTPDPCAPVFMACEAAGFSQAKDAPAGKKLWQDCASPLLEGKAVASIKLDAKAGPYCKKYKMAKDAFQGRVKTLPARDNVTLPIREQLIVELYSK